MGFVEGAHLVGGREPLDRCRRQLPAGGPAIGVGHHAGDVGQYVTGGAQFPVQDRCHLAAGRHHAIVKPVVAVHYPGSLLDRNPGGQHLVGLQHLRQVTGGGLFELGPPSLQLALDVTVVATQVRQPDGFQVDIVEAG